VAVIVDSDAVIGFLDRGDALHDAADALIRKHFASRPLLASAVTYAEVMTGVRIGKHDERPVREFFSELIASVLPVEVQVAETAASLRARHAGLRMPDALILASAQIHPDVTTVISGDAQWAKLPGLDLQIESLG
jgi:predicted nucleic acid-binding protein